MTLCLFSYYFNLRATFKLNSKDWLRTVIWHQLIWGTHPYILVSHKSITFFNFTIETTIYWCHLCSAFLCMHYLSLYTQLWHKTFGCLFHCYVFDPNVFRTHPLPKAPWYSCTFEFMFCCLWKLFETDTPILLLNLSLMSKGGPSVMRDWGKMSITDELGMRMDCVIYIFMYLPSVIFSIFSPTILVISDHRTIIREIDVTILYLYLVSLIMF